MNYVRTTIVALTALFSAATAQAQEATDWVFIGYQPCTQGQPQCVQWPANDQYKGNWERAIQRYELTEKKCAHHLEVSYALTGRGICSQF